MSAYAHPQFPTNLSQEFLDQYIGNRLERVCIAFMILEVSIVGLRLYAKRMITSSQGWDDYLIYPALLTNLGACALGIVFLRNAGVGYHVPAVYLRNPANFMHLYTTFLKCTFCLQLLYFFAVALPKLSILFLYLRVFPQKMFRFGVFFTMFIVIGTVVSSCFAAVFQCDPVAAQWNPSIPGKCFNTTLFYRMSIQNAISDFVMLVLPLPIVWKLNTSRERKIGLTVVFVMGSIGIVASCIRLSVFFSTNAFNDATWTGVRLIAWSIIEPGMYLVAACLPGCRPLVAQLASSNIRARFFPTSGLKASDLDIEKGTEDRNSFTEGLMKGTAQSHQSNIFSESRSNSRATSRPDYGHTRMPSMNRIEVTHDVLVVSTSGPAKPPPVRLLHKGPDYGRIIRVTDGFYTGDRV